MSSNKMQEGILVCLIDLLCENFMHSSKESAFFFFAPIKRKHCQQPRNVSDQNAKKTRSYL